MDVLSLFSGVGSFEKALTNMDIEYNIVGFSEIDKWAIESYCALHNVDKSLNLGDIKEVKEVDLPCVDLVTYGFPCKDVAVQGKGKGIKDGTRSGLLFEAERIIRHTQPKYAIAENVKNLIGRSHKKDFEALLERLDSYGYNNYWSVLNSVDFGVAQNRERVFIVSIRKDVDDGEFSFPCKESSSVELEDFLLDKVDEKYFINNDSVRAALSKLDNLHGDKRYVVASRGRYLKGNTGKTRQNLEVNYNGVSNTITTVPKDNWVLEPGKNGVSKVRKLTPLECWRLMGFDDIDYWVARQRLEEVFYKGGDRSDSQMYKQAGNAIVVGVLEGIFESLLM